MSADPANTFSSKGYSFRPSKGPSKVPRSSITTAQQPIAPFCYRDIQPNIAIPCAILRHPSLHCRNIMARYATTPLQNLRYMARGRLGGHISMRGLAAYSLKYPFVSSQAASTLFRLRSFLPPHVLVVCLSDSSFLGSSFLDIFLFWFSMIKHVYQPCRGLGCAGCSPGYR
jgi:hypothetical protein